MNVINDAIDFAFEKHKSQVRKYNGEPYIQHPARVASQVSLYTQSGYVIAAAWLHDVMEDCNVSYNELKSEFGGRVANIVKDLTNVFTKDNYPELKRTKRKALEVERLGKIGYHATIIKGCDRKDNLDTMDVAQDLDFAVIYYQESVILAKELTKNNYRMEWMLNYPIQELAQRIKEERKHGTVGLKV